MKVYSLTKSGKEFAKKCDSKTHAGCVVHAVQAAGGKATAAQIAERAKATLEKVSNMAPRKAVSFMLFDLSKRRGILSAREAK